ncbi:MAG: dCTP deaminase domain-containing protein [Candidatus Bipolaricaulaceae bacterium]
MILCDREIKKLCEQDPPMIDPFVPEQRGKPSWGLGSFGYDIRLGDRFLVPLGGVNAVLDPLNFPREHFREVVAEARFDLAPHSQVLAESVENFNIPPDVMGLCWGKSSYARCGLLVNVTPLECFDDQTEILTLEGWKKFEDLAPGEIVATLDKDGVLEYHPIIARQKRWYEGEMIAIKGRSIDLLVTPEHQLYVRRQGKFDFELLQAGDLEGYYKLECKRDSFWPGESPEEFVLAPLPNEGRAATRDVALQVFDVLEELKEVTTPELYGRLEPPRPARRTFHRLMAILTNLGAVERHRVHSSEGRPTGASQFWRYRLKKRIDDFGLPEPIAVPTEAWVKFFGLWLAEGSAYRSKRGDYVVKLASLETNTKQQLRGILNDLPFKWHEIPRGFEIVNKQLCTYLMRLGHTHEKHVPAEIKKLSPHLLRKFLWGYILGDGDLATLTASSSSRALIDDLQEIGLKAGWPASYWIAAEPGEPVHANPNYTSSYTHFRIRFSKDGTSRYGRAKEAWSRVPYKGHVYDVTVPPNHTIYVRRNGKAVWSGNCGWRGKLTIELANLSPLPIRLHVGQGIAQVVFFHGQRPDRTYATKEAGGVYQDQEGVTLPR